MLRVLTRIVMLFVLLGTGLAADQGGTTPPPVPVDLSAMRGIPTLQALVTDAAGVPIAGAAVNYRGLVSGLRGGGMTDKAGRYAMHPGLQWSSPATGWQFSWVGAHQIEVVASGFTRWVAESVDLVAGQTYPLRVVLEPRGPVTLLEPASYQRLAAERVLKMMTGTKDAKGQVTIIGDPILLPEFARARTTRDSRSLPEAFVQAATFVDGSFREPVVVQFQDGQPEARFSYISNNGFLDLEEQDWKTVSALLSDFYAVAADVSRGPERFEPYLPADMRKMLDLRGEKNRLFLTPESVRTLSNDQLRRYVALTFDLLSLMPWVTLNAVAVPRSVGWAPRDVRSDPVGVIAATEQAVADLRLRLRSSGALDPDRVAASNDYVRRMLGEGYLVREDPERDGIRNLPRRARMFTAALGGVFPHVVIDNGELRIVAVDMNWKTSLFVVLIWITIRPWVKTRSFGCRPRNG